MGVAQQACEVRAGLVGRVECWQMHCVIWCCRVSFFFVLELVVDF